MTNLNPPDITPHARLLAAQSLARAAATFPNLDPQPLSVPGFGLDPREARLATAIHRAAMQRWLTAEYLLDQFLRQPCRRLQAELRGVLMAGAVQLLFFDRLPAYAVVDESVNLARQLVRKNARGLVNAVLRKLADAIDHHDAKTPWSPAANRLPVEAGTLFLKSDCLPDPATHWVKHVSVVTSHPSALVERWLAIFGPQTTQQLCHHGIQTPPIIVAVEPGSGQVVEWPSGQVSEKTDSDLPPLPPGEGRGEGATVIGNRLLLDVTAHHSSTIGECNFTPHTTPGYLVWQSDHAALTQFLKQHPARRVQDPASAQPVLQLEGLSPKIIIDLCAGRGTKTRQLALMFPHARIIASDVDAQRTVSLHEVAVDFKNVQVIAPEKLDHALAGDKADLLLLDVPCSNTAVLARRPEARYRFRPSTIQSLVALQRDIIARGLSLAAPGAHLLYATCSLDPSESQEQAQHMVTEHSLTLLRETHDLPAGTGATYHDGYFAALLQR